MDDPSLLLNAVKIMEPRRPGVGWSAVAEIGPPNTERGQAESRNQDLSAAYSARPARPSSSWTAATGRITGRPMERELGDGRVSRY